MMIVSQQEAKAIVPVLRSALNRGIPEVTGRWSSWSALPWWKRWINSWWFWDNKPFHDEANYRAIDLVPLDSETEAFVKTTLIKLSHPPRCRRCGGTNLEADPAGYYIDAERWDGAPLLCLDHDD